MKSLMVILICALIATGGALGFACVERTKLCENLSQVTESRDALAARVAQLEKELATLKDNSAKDKAAYAQLEKELATLKDKAVKDKAAYAQMTESRDALAARVAQMEKELATLNNNAEKNRLAPMIEAVKSAQSLIAAQKTIREATTSLAKSDAEKKYKALVEPLKGRRVVFSGKVKNAGNRIVSLSGLYLTLTVDKDFDVKFIFEKEAQSQLLSLKAGDEVLLEGYVVSTGDLLHNLTVGGPTFPTEQDYNEVLRLGGLKE